MNCATQPMKTFLLLKDHRPIDFVVAEGDKIVIDIGDGDHFTLEKLYDKNTGDCTSDARQCS